MHIFGGPLFSYNYILILFLFIVVLRIFPFVASEIRGLLLDDRFGRKR